MVDLWIRDKYSGNIHKIGDDPHDCLMVDEKGTIRYYNLQCGEGSKYGSYSFVTDENGTLPKDDEVLVKHGAEAYFNIGGWPNINDVLDRIRTEIEQSRYGLVNDGLDLALKIIDKYRKDGD